MAKTASSCVTSMTSAHRRARRSEGRLFKLRFQLATGQLENHAEIRTGTQREIARINTEIRPREIAAAEAVAGSEA